ncbi:MAG: hypothetical protein Q9218_007641 [Villophora microphyllina]
MKPITVLSLFLCTLANGAPRTVKRTASMLVDATFDNHTASAVPEANFVNVYKGLFYNAWDPINLESPTSGSAPHTIPNGIATTTVTSQATRGTPTLTVDYAGSKTLFFDFFSFYFGCVIPAAQGVAQEAEQCSILVAGFDSNNKEIAVATFTFEPLATNLVKAPMIQAVLPTSFVGLHNVTIVQSSPATQVLLVDDPKYRLYASS